MATVNDNFAIAKYMVEFHKEMDSELEDALIQLRDIEKVLPKTKIDNDVLAEQVKGFIKNGKFWQQIVDEHTFDKAQEVLTK